MIVVHSATRGALLIDTSLCATVAHHIAEAFVTTTRATCSVHRLLVAQFGLHCARTYAIDMSVTNLWTITFSRRLHPKTLAYRGAVAAVASEHALELRLFLSCCNLAPFDSAVSRCDRPAYLRN